MTDMSPFKKQLKAQRDAYANDLPGRLAGVQQLWAQAADGSEVALRRLATEVHNIRGSAGMYGFPSVSKAAGLLDVALNVWLDSGAALEDEYDKLDALVRALTRLGNAEQEGSLPLEPVPVTSTYYEQPLILVVDDEQSVRDGIRFYLEQAGFRSVAAANGFQAIEVAGQHLPDVVLMDIQMPYMDGIQATQRIHENPRLREVPVVFLTAEDSLDKVLKALSFCAAGYLIKPVRMQAIASKLTAVLLEAA